MSKPMLTTLQRFSGYSRIPEMSHYSLTVGICALTELRTTVQLVDTSLQNATRHDLRVVVVTPNSLIARRLAGRDPRIQVILERSREGKASAMNKMLKAVQSGIVVYASADVAIEEDVIPAMVEALTANPSYGAVIAHVEPTNKEDGIMGKISSLIWELFNRVNKKLDDETKLSQANDLYVFWRNLVDEIPTGTINDDTYIASAIRRHGFLIKKATAKVRISGPTTPFDYILQRSRIILGHLQTIRTQKVVPSVFEFTALSSPFRNLRILTETIAEGGIGHCLASLAASQLELMSWLHAMLMTVFRQDASVWKVAAGTKQVSEERKRPEKP
jgi:cellulose synthase/poly-beta-1,6-N-acetylglucosamine synthase-like glycosyltransferase